MHAVMCCGKKRSEEKIKMLVVFIGHPGVVNAFRV